MALGTGSITLNEVFLEVRLPAGPNLTACFAAARDGLFDPIYSGSKDRLSNFRGYGL